MLKVLQAVLVENVINYFITKGKQRKQRYNSQLWWETDYLARLTDLGKDELEKKFSYKKLEYVVKKGEK